MNQLLKLTVISFLSLNVYACSNILHLIIVTINKSYLIFVDDVVAQYFFIKKIANKNALVSTTKNIAVCPENWNKHFKLNKFKTKKTLKIN